MEKSNKSHGMWIDHIFNSLGKPVHMETSDGSRRSGRLSGFRTKVILFNGHKQDVITELELNGDPTDTIPLNTLHSLKIDTIESMSGRRA